MSFEISISGSFLLNKPLSHAQGQYLRKFGSTRRMKRSVELLKECDDFDREAARLPLGIDGEYYVGSQAKMGQDLDHPSVFNNSKPPAHQPGLWCGWSPSKNLKKIVWNKTPDFDAKLWLEYIVLHFLEPWGYELNGKALITGEDESEIGELTISANRISFRSFESSNHNDYKRDVDNCINFLKDSNVKHRRTSAEALPSFVGYSGPEPELLSAAFAALAEAMADEDALVRKKSAKSLLCLLDYDVHVSPATIRTLERLHVDSEPLLKATITKILNSIIT